MFVGKGIVIWSVVKLSHRTGVFIGKGIVIFSTLARREFDRNDMYK